jgi:hypothetical protein
MKIPNCSAPTSFFPFHFPFFVLLLGINMNFGRRVLVSNLGFFVPEERRSRQSVGSDMGSHFALFRNYMCQNFIKSAGVADI